MGLGLAIARHLVELHGGLVKAESLGEGMGATFTVTIPLMRSVQTSAEENRIRHNFPIVEGVRVLVVDDEPDNLELITFTLEQYGVEVRAVSSSREALSILAQWQPDLLLSDIGMPEMDGYTFIQKLRDLPTEQDRFLPAIALTAYAGETNHQQALSAGFQKHLTKPVDPVELIFAIGETLGKG